MTVKQKKYLKILRENPAQVGRWCGFDDLRDIHNDWLKEMIFGTEDYTLQAHRLSYKTTCLSIAIALYMICFPAKSIMFYRKTDDDVAEVLKQTSKVLQNAKVRYIANQIWNTDLFLTENSNGKITTNIYRSPRGASQLIGLGIKTSMTGKHADFLITDDIVNITDRVSKAERDKTKLAYQELQNIRNHGGRILNTGTPWHIDDCFTLMPNIHKWDCYTTGIMPEELIEEKKTSMIGSLFAANYELRHIAGDDVIFSNPQYFVDKSNILNGNAHIDAAYGGEDYTAFTICNKKGNSYYIYGKLWHKHVDDCRKEILQLCNEYLVGKVYCENNGDKGYLARDLKSDGLRVISYHENMNKHLKITTFLKSAWGNTSFLDVTDTEFINQIINYTENAEHDDAPDSVASIIRKIYYKNTSNYKPIWG